MRYVNWIKSTYRVSREDCKISNRSWEKLCNAVHQANRMLAIRASHDLMPIMLHETSINKMHEYLIPWVRWVLINFQGWTSVLSLWQTKGDENVKSARECWLQTQLEIDNSFKICLLRMECIVYMSIFDIKQLWLQDGGLRRWSITK